MIELLVIIAIIAILAGMLLPALKKARDMAKSSACLNNQKNCGTMIAMYTDTFNGIMHGFAQFSIDTGKNRYSWADALENSGLLLKTEKPYVVMCPSLTTTSRNYVGPRYQGTADGYLNYTYGMPVSVGVSSGIVGQFYKTSLALYSTYTNLSTFATVNSYLVIRKFQQPSKALLLADSIWSKLDNHQETVLTYYSDRSSPSRTIHLRHLGKFNSYFIDGHAANISILDLQANMRTGPDYLRKNSNVSFTVIDGHNNARYIP